MTTERARIAELEAALKEAIEGMDEMIRYVPAYFREKWEHDAYLASARSALEATWENDYDRHDPARC